MAVAYHVCFVLCILNLIHGSFEISEKDLELRIDKIAALNEKLKKELNSQKLIYNELVNRVGSIDSKKVDNNDQKRQLASDQCSPIVFHARLSSSIYPIGTNQIVAYDNVVTNVGNGYDSYTGLFRAPVAGFYEFIATMWSTDGNYLEFEMVRNGVDVCYGRASQTNQTMGTCVSMIQLAEGDRVWVRHLNGGGTYANGGNFPDFAGHLIH